MSVDWLSVGGFRMLGGLKGFESIIYNNGSGGVSCSVSFGIEFVQTSLL